MMQKVNRFSILALLLWLLIVPAGTVYIFQTQLPQSVNWLYIGLFTILGIGTVLIPINRNGKPVFLVMWLTVPVFLIYGLAIEMIIMQIFIFATLFKKSKVLSVVDRFFINSLYYFLLSIISASVFHLAGGKIGTFDFWPLLLAVLAYQLTHTLLNELIIFIFAYHLKLKSIYLEKNLLVSVGIVIVTLPCALTLYYLLEYIGIASFFLLGIPFFFITILFRLYKNSEKINVSLRQAGGFGHEISAELKEDDVIDHFVNNVSSMFNAEYTYLFDYKDGWLEPIRAIEHGKILENLKDTFFLGQGVAGITLLKNEPVIFYNRNEWEGLANGYVPSDMESIIGLPIVRNQKVEGVLLISSVRKDGFEEYQLKILDLLSSYFTVSVEKARYVELKIKQSNRCSLTKLYNYRYLENEIEEKMDLVNSGHLEELSILMLDIDYFKQINDMYGHQSGNDILVKLARLFEEMLPKDGIVGRYGGEEFVYVLPGMSKTIALFFAENLRLKVESFPFRITPDLGEERMPIDVYITISVGVSSAPIDTDEAKAILRNADRSLYLGAKQTGRNRVASYVR
ncbi:sensor domain-containing diguanylate cyclase [Sporosarcina sp. CAU 1771]